MPIKERIETWVKQVLGREDGFVLVHPKELHNGDYTLIINSPTAEADFEKLAAAKIEELEKVEFAPPRFINLRLSKKFFKESLREIIEKGDTFGKGEHAKGFKVVIEYTDPNVMKPFHIGHLMSNSIGEALSRIFESNGAALNRVNYYSDSGLNIAKAVWGIKNKLDSLPQESAAPWEKSNFLGEAYAHGVKSYEADQKIAAEITEINKKIFVRSDDDINKLYDLGKRWSLAHLEELYARLGTKFDKNIPESEIAESGKQFVLDFLDKGIFEKSEGAIIFRGEKYNPKLHTRVFITKDDLPTYEAKELGVTHKKFELYNPDLSVVITANEQNDYFKVVLEALKQINEPLALKTKHLSHGILKLPTGKMSSRTGNVITAEDLIKEVTEKTKGDERVAIAAIKYMILRQGIGQDIIFDFEKSVSTEGDSGVYLQYAHARANSILEKAGQKGDIKGEMGETREIEKMLYRFPEIVERAGAEYAPNYIVTYLTELASAFNNFYAHEKVLDESPESAYRLAIVEAFKIVMQNGLTVLGIPAPERM